MKTAVIFDSVYGNTERVARAIGGALGASSEVEVLRASDVQPQRLTGVRVLVVGAPTQKFRPTPAVTSLLQRLPARGLEGVRVAAFDTRINVREARSAMLNFFIWLQGSAAYAAQHIADGLRRHGGELIAPSEGFFVRGTEGPLLEGELERAAAWARQLLAAPQVPNPEPGKVSRPGRAV